MRLRIDGRHFTVTEDIKQKVNEGIAKFDKFLHNIVEVHLVLEIEKYRHIAEVLVYAKNKVLKSREVSQDMHLSIEKALRNMDRQLKQLKEKVKGHQVKSPKETQEI